MRKNVGYYVLGRHKETGALEKFRDTFVSKKYALDAVRVGGVCDRYDFFIVKYIGDIQEVSEIKLVYNG